MSKKIYIAGAVSGIERTVVTAKFYEMERKLKEMGFVPVNPVNLVPAISSWTDAMKICIKALVDCDGFVKLCDWEESKGAMIEVSLARNLGLLEYTVSNRIEFYRDWKKE